MSQMNDNNDVEMKVATMPTKTSTAQESSHMLSSSNSSSSDDKGKQKGKKRKVLQIVKKEGTKSSIVWKKFTKFKNSEGKWRASCNFCAKENAADSNLNGTTSLQNHIPVCHKDPDNLKKQLSICQQKDDDGEVDSGTVKTWKFDQDKIRKELLKMIIVDELPFSFVEKEGFQEFMQVVCPHFHIPSRHTISRDCAQTFLEEKLKLKNFFQKTRQKVSLTTDTWTSNQNVNYMCLTSHFIDDDFVLHKRILNFTPIFSHKGAKIGRLIEKCLLDWGINNVMTVTLDNASSNDVVIQYLKEKLDNCVLGAKFLHMRCVAHIINLVVRDDLKEHDASISRVRAAVRFVRQSPSRLERFKECVKESGIDNKSLLSLDCPTRWNSTFDMLHTSQKFEKAFNFYEIKDLTYKHDLEETCGVPGRSDWKNVRKFATFLELFYKLRKNISNTSYVTSNAFFHEIVDVDFHLREYMKDNDLGLKIMSLKMKEKYDKYWGSVEKMNKLMYVAVVLDPRHKMEYLEFSFENMYKKEGDDDVPNFSLNLGESQGDSLSKKMIDLVRATTYELFNYKLKFGAPRQVSKEQSVVAQQSLSQNKSQMRELFKLRKMGGSVSGETKTELDPYLNEECDDDVDDFDILLWWKNNSARFPILSRMAKHVLEIPISTVASESAFSTGGRVLDSFRSSWSTFIVESLICTQDWIRKLKKHIKVEEDLEIQDNLAKELYEKLHLGDGSSVGGTSLGATSGWGTT